MSEAANIVMPKATGTWPLWVLVGGRKALLISCCFSYNVPITYAPKRCCLNPQCPEEPLGSEEGLETIEKMFGGFNPAKMPGQ
jgi:hypothetical protein